jgi:hypothetical protein
VLKYKQITLYCDFETTSYSQYLVENKTRVYLGGFATDKSERVTYFFSIEEFFDIIKSYATNHTHINIFFHNLGFDISFILYYLNNIGYTHYCRKKGEFELPPNTYDLFINLQGQIYTCDLILYNCRISFKDSLKKLPTTIKNLGKIVGLDKLDETHNYNEFKPVYKNKNEVPTEELEYLKNDILILKKAIEMYCENKHFKNCLTSSSLSYNSWLDTYFKGTYSHKYYEDINNKKEQLLNILPEITDDEMISVINKSYRGGITYLNPEMAGVDTYGVSYDVNSLYPFSMIKRKYPCGTPQFVEEYNPNKLQLITFMVGSCECKGTIPFIPIAQHGKSYTYDKYLKPNQFTLWGEEFELFKKHYTDKVYIVSILEFNEIENLFDEYILALSKIKEETKDSGVRYMTKLKLNGLGGKFGTKSIQTKKVCLGNVNKNGGLAFGLAVEEIGDFYYKPIASYMTSQARCLLINAITPNFDRFIYCDTDSMYLKGYENAVGIEVHNTKLGAFKKEHVFNKGRFLHTKCYIIEENGQLTHSIAGCNNSAKQLINFDNFNFGLKLPNANLKALQVVGGVVLKPTDFSIQKT